MKKLRNFPMWKPWPPWVEASDSCTPNQTSMMVASAMHMRTPKASIVGDAVAAEAAHPWVIQLTTPIRHLRQAHPRPIGLPVAATVGAPQNRTVVGARPELSAPAS